MTRRFPPPWQVEQTPGGFKVLDANVRGGEAAPYFKSTHRIHYRPLPVLLEEAEVAPSSWLNPVANPVQFRQQPRGALERGRAERRG
jgi:hypothetical protein